MTFLEFRKKMAPYPAFSVKEIEKTFPAFDRRRLVEWQEKGHIRKIRNQYYCLSEVDVDETLQFTIANLIYKPSYISLESALSYYGIIPEGVFAVTSCSTLKTAGFDTSVGRYTYRHIKPSLYFGYRVKQADSHKVLLAEPEKAVLDMLYLSPGVTSVEDLISMRWDRMVIRDKVFTERLSDYQRAIDSKALDRRIMVMKEYVDAES